MLLHFAAYQHHFVLMGRILPQPQFPGEGLREWTFHTHRVPRHGEGNGFITLFGYDQGFCKEEQVPERVARLDATHVFLKARTPKPQRNSKLLTSTYPVPYTGARLGGVLPLATGGP